MGSVARAGTYLARFTRPNRSCPRLSRRDLSTRQRRRGLPLDARRLPWAHVQVIRPCPHDLPFCGVPLGAASLSGARYKSHQTAATLSWVLKNAAHSSVPPAETLSACVFLGCWRKIMMGFFTGEDVSNELVHVAIPVFEMAFPGKIACFIFDNASTHTGRSVDALCAKKMNVHTGPNAKL